VTLFVTENTMASKDNNHKYGDNHREKDEVGESTAMSKKQRMSGDDNDSSSSSIDDFSLEEEVYSEEETIQ
jgi:hypothetical protein